MIKFVLSWADSPLMELLDVARANEVVHTNPLSHGSSNHANTLPLPSLTTLAQAAIKKQAISMLRDGIAPDIQQHLINGFLPYGEENDKCELHELHQTFLLINQKIHESIVSLTDIEGLSTIMTMILSVNSLVMILVI